MSHDLPIACSLDSSRLTARVGEMHAIGRDALVEAERPADGVAVLRFRAGHDVRRRLEDIVAAEAECCAFMKLSLSDETGAIAMTVEAPEEAEPVIAGLVEAFAAA
jgi:hypothetical protein